MTSQTVLTFTSVRRKLYILAGLVLFILPTAGRAETVNLINTVAAKPALLEIVPTGAMANTAADSVLASYRGVSLSVNCGSSDTAETMREQIGLLTPVKSTANLKNLTFKISFTF